MIQAGRVSGSITLTKIRRCPAPSILAASSIEYGMARKYCRARKMNSGLPPKKAGTISGSQVSYQPMLLYSWNSGIRPTTPGSSMLPTNR